MMLSMTALIALLVALVFTTRMAQAANEFYREIETGPLPKVARAIIATKKFGAGTGTLLAGTMVAFNTSTGFWVPWIEGGANGADVFKGFVFPDSIVLAAGGEVDGDVMIRGVIARSSVLAVVNGANTTVAIDAELAINARNLGIEVQGLAGVR